MRDLDEEWERRNTAKELKKRSESFFASCGRNTNRANRDEHGAISFDCRTHFCDFSATVVRDRTVVHRRRLTTCGVERNMFGLRAGGHDCDWSEASSDSKLAGGSLPSRHFLWTGSRHVHVRLHRSRQRGRFRHVVIRGLCFGWLATVMATHKMGPDRA